MNEYMSQWKLKKMVLANLTESGVTVSDDVVESMVNKVFNHTSNFFEKRKERKNCAICLHYFIPIRMV